MSLRRSLAIAAIALSFLAGRSAEARPAPDPLLLGSDIETAIETCLSHRTERVELMEDGETICWNSAIFPLELAKFAQLSPDAKRLVFSSRGGNVLTAITLANLISSLDMPVVFAGECVSACASIVAPGVTGARIHKSAYFLIHGITSFDSDTFLDDYKARKTAEADDNASPTMLGFAAPGAWNYYRVQWPRNEKYLMDRGISPDYMLEAEHRMIAAKDALGCPLELFDYFAILTREHILSHLGDRFSVVDDFADDWTDPRISEAMPYLKPISEDGVVAYSYEMHKKGCGAG